MMYAVEILEKEKALIIAALSKWETEYYPDAKKEREMRLKQLNRAIEVIKKYIANEKI